MSEAKRTGSIKYIVSARGMPFVDQDAALSKASVMTSETGEPYVVCPHPEGGIAVVRKADYDGDVIVDEGYAQVPVMKEGLPDGELAPNPMVFNQSEPTAQTQRINARSEQASPVRNQENIKPPEKEMTFRPDPKAYLFLIMEGGIGTVVLLMPDLVWQLLGMIGFSPDATGISFVLNFAAIFFVLHGLGTTGYQMLANTYKITKKGVSAQKGIVSREIDHIVFHNIVSVEVTQSILGRILGVGNLEFASSGTAEAEVRFKEPLIKSQ